MHCLTLFALKIVQILLSISERFLEDCTRDFNLSTWQISTSAPRNKIYKRFIASLLASEHRFSNSSQVFVYFFIQSIYNQKAPAPCFRLYVHRILKFTLGCGERKGPYASQPNICVHSNGSLHLIYRNVPIKYPSKFSFAP